MNHLSECEYDDDLWADLHLTMTLQKASVRGKFIELRSNLARSKIESETRLVLLNAFD